MASGQGDGGSEPSPRSLFKMTQIHVAIKAMINPHDNALMDESQTSVTDHATPKEDANPIIYGLWIIARNKLWGNQSRRGKEKKASRRLRLHQPKLNQDNFQHQCGTRFELLQCEEGSLMDNEDAPQWNQREYA
ncbi:hypothetical protein VNO78_31806 [Psophocarpus tetragonolobus]|uniref:Uncharacterized protein n=1 Tax=Psophocarpus tetragonolobus TaxID=3891 RepID=A0AAN9X9V7_PSOTE